MIELKNINFQYHRKKQLFSDLNLNIEPNHIYGLLGRNGAGKTTLLKIISGLCFPSSGDTTVLGKHSFYRNQEMLKQVYFVPEEIHSPHMTISSYAKNYAPFYPHFNQNEFEDFLKEFEIDHPNQYIHKLSHGQKKKVIIAFALATNTSIVLLDEPTNGLDIPSKSIFRKVLSSAASEERLIIISTHQVRDLHSLIDSTIILDNGEIILNASNDEITQKLIFKIEDENDDPSSILYRENSIKGNVIIKENFEQKESLLDLELFFNALMINKRQITDLFKYKRKEI